MRRILQAARQDGRACVGVIMQLVNRAAERGQSEVQAYRFPNSLCTDRGRKINNSELGWEETLEGRPKLGLRILS